MTEESLFSTEKIHMLYARILSFAVGYEQEEYFSTEDIISTEFEVNSEESLNPEHKLVMIILRISSHVDFQRDSEKDKIHIEKLGDFRIGFTFLIDNFNELIQGGDTEEDSYQIDSLLLRHLLAMAYSTARGMILVKTTGTILENAILPIIDPQELMEGEES